GRCRLSGSRAPSQRPGSAAAKAGLPWHGRAWTLAQRDRGPEGRWTLLARPLALGDAGLALLGARLCLALGGALRTLPLGHTLELGLLALLDCFLGLLDARRHREGRKDGLRIVEERQALARGEI